MFADQLRKIGATGFEIRAIEAYCSDEQRAAIENAKHCRDVKAVYQQWRASRYVKAEESNGE